MAAGLDRAEVVFITVGTPSNADGSPDLRFVRQVAQSIGAHLGGADQGQGFTVIVNKSTVPIGSGNWVGSLVRDAYEGAHGHRPDGRFAVASNPEFLREGAAVHDSLYPDRIVLGSDDERAINVLTHLYRPLLNQDFRAPRFAPRPDDLIARRRRRCEDKHRLKRSRTQIFRMNTDKKRKKSVFILEICVLSQRSVSDIQGIHLP